MIKFQLFFITIYRWYIGKVLEIKQRGEFEKKEEEKKKTLFLGKYF